MAAPDLSFLPFLFSVHLCLSVCLSVCDCLLACLAENHIFPIFMLIILYLLWSSPFCEHLSDMPAQNKAPSARCWSKPRQSSSITPTATAQCLRVHVKFISNDSPGPLVGKCAQAMKTLDIFKETAAFSMDSDTESSVESSSATLFRAALCLHSNIMDNAMRTVFPIE